MAEPQATSDAAPMAAQRAAGGVRRVRGAWRGLASEQRLAGIAALALLFTMFLPWYTATRPVVIKGHALSVADSQSAITVFSFVEAAVLLVALGVLALLFGRGERRAFHLPGGDGAVITLAGAWACVLIIWRFFDKPDLGAKVTVGLQWGIFVALAAAAALAWAGNRVRGAHRPEPQIVPEPRPRPPGEPVAVRIPDDRPHLDETRVLPDRTPGVTHEGETAASRRRAGPPPLSRESAAKDTAEFRAVPPGEEPADEETRPLPPREEPADEETRPLPPREEPADEETRPLPPRPDRDRTQQLPPRDDDQPTLPGMPD